MRIYIIGSMSQIGYIEILQDFLKHSFKGYTVEAVRRRPDKDIKELISDCFSKIEHSDIIVALAKPDGTYGEGVLYEIEYANRLHKIIFGIGEGLHMTLVDQIHDFLSIP